MDGGRCCVLSLLENGLTQLGLGAPRCKLNGALILLALTLGQTPVSATRWLTSRVWCSPAVTPQEMH